MAARDTEQLLTRLESFVPSAVLPLRSILAGEAAALQATEAFAADCADAATWSGAEGIWLGLHARSVGTQRRGGEPDDDLRVRLRTVEGQVTPTALLDGVRALTAQYTSAEPRLAEWWQGPYLGRTFLGADPFARISPGPNGFLVLLPAALGETGWGEAHLGDTFLDDSFIGVEEADIIGLISAEVVRRRAAGVRAWVVILND